MNHCRVCYSTITQWRNEIREHFDSAGIARCPMSGQPFTLAGDGVRNTVWRKGVSA